MRHTVFLWSTLIVCAVCTSGWAAVGEWSHTVLYGGDIRGVGINRVDPSTIYAITYGEYGTPYSAQFYKSTDGGDNWVSRSEGLNETTEFFLNCLAIDPENSTTIFIGGMLRYSGIGYIYKSTDEGESWEERILDGPVRDIVLNPINSQEVYLATDVGVYKSTDFGDNWDLTTLTYITRSVGCEDCGDAIWAGTESNGVYRSIDGGTSWIFEGLDGYDVQCLYCDPCGVYYAGTDSGLYFRTILSDWENVLPIEIHAINGCEDIDIYVGTEGEGIYKGREFTWAPCNSGLTNSTIVSLDINPLDHQNIYVGSSFSGIYRTADGGAFWGCCNQGLRRARIKAIVSHPTVPGAVMAATGWGIFNSTDGGETWKQASYGLTHTPMYGQLDIGGITFDPTNPGIAYLEYDNSSLIYKTTNGGKSWNLKNNGLALEIMSNICIDPHVPQTLYVGGSFRWFKCSVYKSTNGGNNWFRSDKELPEGSELGTVTSLAIHPFNPSVLYAGCEWVDMFTYRRLYKTLNAGSSWSSTSLSESASEIRIDPYVPNMVHVWDPNTDTFWRSINGGNSWASLPWKLPTEPIEFGIDGSNFDRLFTSTWSGDTTRIYWSIIDGRWWQLGPELPFGEEDGNAASSIAIDPYGPHIYVGAQSSGVYTYSKPLSIALIPDGPLPVQVPAGGELGITFIMQNLTEVDRELLLITAVYNTKGKKVYRKQETVFIPAQTTLEDHRSYPINSHTPPSKYALRVGMTEMTFKEVHDAAGIGFTVTESQ
jgi:photosystem II stability/assembly factor-like uncharacterized protein